MSSYRTFLIEWKYENDKGVEFSKIEEYIVKRLRNSDAEVFVAYSFVNSHFQRDTQPRWQGYFLANHAFIWDKPMQFMYCHVSLEDFTEHGVRADRVEI